MSRMEQCLYFPTVPANISLDFFFLCMSSYLNFNLVSLLDIYLSEFVPFQHCTSGLSNTGGLCLQTMLALAGEQQKYPWYETKATCPQAPPPHSVDAFLHLQGSWPNTFHSDWEEKTGLVILGSGFQKHMGGKRRISVWNRCSRTSGNWHCSRCCSWTALAVSFWFSHFFWNKAPTDNWGMRADVWHYCNRAKLHSVSRWKLWWLT